MSEWMSFDGTQEKIDFVEHYKTIEDSYIPGDKRPPAFDEWRYRYSEYYYEIIVDKGKSLCHLISYRKPIIRNGFLGIYNQDESVWRFVNVKDAINFQVKKFVTKVRYRIAKQDDSGIDIAFKKDPPELIGGDDF